MKRTITIFGLTALIFISLTLSTASIRTPVDGDDTYGFPLAFFVRFSDMCAPCPPNPTETYYWSLIVDVLFAAMLSVISLIIFLKLKAALKSDKRAM